MIDNAIMMKFDFIEYEEIPSDTAGYILTVADADNIGEIPIEHINDFLNGLEAYIADVHNPVGEPIGHVSPSFE
jgi:hypothetical protein